MARRDEVVAFFGWQRRAAVSPESLARAASEA